MDTESYQVITEGGSQGEMHGWQSNYYEISGATITLRLRVAVIFFFPQQAVCLLLSGEHVYLPLIKDLGGGSIA